MVGKRMTKRTLERYLFFMACQSSFSVNATANCSQNSINASDKVKPHPLHEERFNNKVTRVALPLVSTDLRPCKERDSFIRLFNLFFSASHILERKKDCSA